jgi:hypothetical protein
MYSFSNFLKFSSQKYEGKGTILQLFSRNLDETKIITIARNYVQWAPLNGITLGPRQTDSINRMIPLTDTHFLVLLPNRPWRSLKNDPINRMNLLTGIPLSGFHCSFMFNSLLDEYNFGEFYLFLSFSIKSFFSFKLLFLHIEICFKFK